MNHQLRISNMIVSGKLPVKHKLSIDEFNKIIQKGNLKWMIVSEERFPILSAKVMERKEKNKNGEYKGVYSYIWASGSINILGALSIKEATKIYDIVFDEIKRACPRALNLENG